MNFIISLIFVCFFINSINIRNATIVKNKLIDKTFYDNSAQKGLSDKDKFNLHHAFVQEKLKWKNGVVFYKLDENFNEDEITEIKRAMNEIESSSCIRFEAHVESHGPENYVMIRKHYLLWLCGTLDVGCSNKGEQVIWLGQGCINLCGILRLLLQTLGFNHHQGRSDRDKYIVIHKRNIVSIEYIVQLKDFVKRIKYDKNFKYLTPFDFNSIMLYGENDMSKNNKAVITPRAKGVKMHTLRTNSTLSKYDKILLNHFYECKNKSAKNKENAKSGADGNIETLMKTVIKVINSCKMILF